MPSPFPSLGPAGGGSPQQFITLKGHREPPDMLIEDISRVGIDGAAFRQVQRRGEPFEMQGTIDLDTMDDAVALFKTLHAYRGTLVDITDDYGDSFTRVMVLDVRRVALRPLLACAGNGVAGAAVATALLVVAFRLQET